MSKTDVSLYANDVAGLLGGELAFVEVAINIFMNDGARDKSSQYFISHSSAQESSLSGMCELPGSVHPLIRSNPTLAELRTKPVVPFKILAL